MDKEMQEALEEMEKPHDKLYYIDQLLNHREGDGCRVLLNGIHVRETDSSVSK